MTRTVISHVVKAHRAPSASVRRAIAHGQFIADPARIPEWLQRGERMTRHPSFRGQQRRVKRANERWNFTKQRPDIKRIAHLRMLKNTEFDQAVRMV